MKPLIAVKDATPVALPLHLWIELPVGNVFTGVRRRWSLERNEGYTSDDDFALWTSPASTECERVEVQWDRYRGYTMTIHVRGPVRGDVIMTAPVNAFCPPDPNQLYCRTSEIRFVPDRGQSASLRFAHRWPTIHADALGGEG